MGPGFMVTPSSSAGHLGVKVAGFADMSVDTVSNERALGSLHEYPLLVLEGHLDTFGHVNNATYLQLFEEARWDLITKGGYGLEVVRETGQGPVVLEVQVKFRRELKNREQAVIESQLISYKKTVAKLRQVIRKGDGTVASEAIFVIALWDTKARKLLVPTDRWLAAIGIRADEIESL
jgi:acyl-CoA thioester hydrolase